MEAKEHPARVTVHILSLSLEGTMPIVLSIDPSLLYLIGNPTEPTAIQEKLSMQFQNKTWANNLALR